MASSQGLAGMRNIDCALRDNSLGRLNIRIAEPCHLIVFLSRAVGCDRVPCQPGGRLSPGMETEV
jgi:hypothetical protein